MFAKVIIKRICRKNFINNLYLIEVFCRFFCNNYHVFCV